MLLHRDLNLCASQFELLPCIQQLSPLFLNFLFGIRHHAKSLTNFLFTSIQKAGSTIQFSSFFLQFSRIDVLVGG